MMPRGRPIALMLVGLAVLSSSCEEPEPPEPIMLVDHELWTEVSADDDPFEDRPEDVDCNPLGWGLSLIHI